MAVNGEECKSNSLLHYSDPDQSWCGLLVQLTPGEYKFTNIIRTMDTVSEQSMYSKLVEWKATEPFETDFFTKLRAGYIYSIEPLITEDKYSIKVTEVCKTNSHIASIKRVASEGLDCLD